MIRWFIDTIRQDTLHKVNSMNTMILAYIFFIQNINSAVFKKAAVILNKPIKNNKSDKI